MLFQAPHAGFRTLKQKRSSTQQETSASFVTSTTMQNSEDVAYVDLRIA